MSSKKDIQEQRLRNIQNSPSLQSQIKYKSNNNSKNESINNTINDSLSNSNENVNSNEESQSNDLNDDNKKYELKTKNMYSLQASIFNRYNDNVFLKKIQQITDKMSYSDDPLYKYAFRKIFYNFCNNIYVIMPSEEQIFKEEDEKILQDYIGQKILLKIITDNESNDYYLLLLYMFNKLYNLSFKKSNLKQNYKYNEESNKSLNNKKLAEKLSKSYTFNDMMSDFTLVKQQIETESVNDVMKNNFKNNVNKTIDLTNELLNINKNELNYLTVNYNKLNIVCWEILKDLLSKTNSVFMNEEEDLIDFVPVNDSKGINFINSVLKYQNKLNFLFKFDNKNKSFKIKAFNENDYQNPEEAKNLYDELVNAYSQLKKLYKKIFKDNDKEYRTLMSFIKEPLNDYTKENVLKNTNRNDYIKNELTQRYNVLKENVNSNRENENDMFKQVEQFYMDVIKEKPQEYIPLHDTNLTVDTYENYLKARDLITIADDNTENIIKEIEAIKDNPTNENLLSNISRLTKTLSPEEKIFIENTLMNKFDKYFSKQIDNSAKAKSQLPQQYLNMFNQDWEKIISDNPYLKNVYSLLSEMSKDKASIIKEQLAHNFYEKYKYLKIVNPTILNNQNFLNLNSQIKEIMNNKNIKNIYKIIKGLTSLNNIDKSNHTYSATKDSFKKSQIAKLSFNYAKLLSKYQDSPSQMISSSVSPYLANPKDETVEEQTEETTLDAIPPSKNVKIGPKLNIKHK